MSSPRRTAKEVVHRYLSNPVARVLVALHVSPNAITLAGVVTVSVAAYFAATGQFLTAGLVMLAGSVLDLFDGAVARLTGQATRTGAYLDSLMDRVGESIMLFGLLMYYVDADHKLGALLAFAAAAISTLVSYSRARAEGLGIKGDVGLLGRPERVVLLSAGLLAGYPVWALGIIVVLGTVTVLQRLVHVSRAVD